ncbi:unnamed protein product [Prorocentrum cordatum]|uniref:RING-type domain-containing protein n=1 Tax=Prorocentrum cordatum TaxID=2364126 RepID=A0ABN9UMT7_9DINO|nr:unnamed protein product [Polarella glacialis]
MCTCMPFCASAARRAPARPRASLAKWAGACRTRGRLCPCISSCSTAAYCLCLRQRSRCSSVPPEVPAARRQELLRALQRQAGAGGGAELRGWNHLPATARHWGSVAVPAPAPPRGDGAEGSEAGVRALLQALPPWQLEADYGEERPCAICHASMNQGDVVCRLPCRHVYHVGCIDRWLRVRATCPMDNLEIGPMLGA